MGEVPNDLVVRLRDALDLRRAVETGTYLGAGARTLAMLFDDVVTIELSEQLHELAEKALSSFENVRTIRGDSRSELPKLIDGKVPTLFFLDGHWSAGNTAGEGAECPVLDELAAIANGHDDDCVIIDDARLFMAPPPPPHDPRHWPSKDEITAVVSATRRRHHLTVFGDQIVVVPERAKTVVEGLYGP